MKKSIYTDISLDSNLERFSRYIDTLLGIKFEYLKYIHNIILLKIILMVTEV